VASLQDQLDTQKNELLDLKSKFEHQKHAFTPLTAVALLESCINKHVVGCRGVCDGYQASQLGIALLKSMTNMQRPQKKFFLKAFTSRKKEIKAATMLLQALLYWVKHIPSSLLSAGLKNIQHNRDAVAHNGGFIEAMYDIDPQSVVDPSTTDSEIEWKRCHPKSCA
jgi:hypothetical protein